MSASSERSRFCLKKRCFPIRVDGINITPREKKEKTQEKETPLTRIIHNLFKERNDVFGGGDNPGKYSFQSTVLSPKSGKRERRRPSCQPPNLRKIKVLF